MSTHPRPALPGVQSHRRPRKMIAFRSPSATSSSSVSSPASSSIGPSRSSPSSANASRSPYPTPTPTILFTLLQDSTPVQYEHLLSSTNSRYPGAPGTALAKAREAAIKAAQAAKREADKKRRDKEELLRLGVGEKMGKRSRDSASAHKRSESPHSTNGNGHSTTNNNSGSRRSQRDKDKDKSGGDGESNHSTRSRGPSVARSPALSGNGFEATQSSDLLSVPSVSHAVNGSGRIRKPASRGNSPIPLTEAHKSPERSIGSSTVHGLGLSTPVGNAAIIHAATRLGAAVTAQPFHSSPLARDSIKSFPATFGDADVDAAEKPMTTRTRSRSMHSQSPLLGRTKELPHGEQRKGEAGGPIHDDIAAAEGEAEARPSINGRAPDAEQSQTTSIPQGDSSSNNEQQTKTVASYNEAVSATSSPVLPAGITA